MNTPAFLSADDPALKLPRRAVPAPAVPDAETQWRLVADMEALREREANLREYEARLRAWQEQLDASVRAPVRPASASPFAGSMHPFSTDTDEEVRAAWEKFHRARALLQAEQNQLRDERMVLRDTQAALKAHEASLAAREAALAEREALWAAQAAPAGDKPPETGRRQTRTPWSVAKLAFGGSK